MYYSKNGRASWKCIHELVYISTLPKLLSGLGDISLSSWNRVTYDGIVSNQFHVPARIIHHRHCLSSIPLGRSNRNRFPMHVSLLSLSFSLFLSHTFSCFFIDSALHARNTSFYNNYTWMRIMLSMHLIPIIIPRMRLPFRGVTSTN